ncbi:MAG: hypothetical protein ACE5FD_12725, partial [Anaerolineae bacterium]
MTIKFYIYDSSNNLIDDPEHTTRKIRGARWGSLWPKGYSVFNGRVKRDILRNWVVRGAQRLIARDGQRVIFDGRLKPPLKQSSSELAALGWYAVLAERRIRKRWIDTAGVSRLEWPSGRVADGDQNRALTEWRDQILRISLVSTGGEISLTTADQYHEQYTLPTGGIVRRVTYDYVARTGQGFDLILYNDDQAAIEDTENVISTTPATGSVDHTFTQGDTNSFTWKLAPDGTDNYDVNDWASLAKLAVYTNYETGHSTGTPNYKTGELMEDVLLLARGSELSADMSLIGEPNITLSAFMSEGDSYETADSLARRLAAYGDGSQNTWGLSVWDGEQSSDGLPQAEFVARSASDYEYEMSVAELQDFKAELTDAELYNWVIVRYTDETGRARFLTPDDDSSLKDTDSISTYGERHSPVVDAGQATQAYALQMGQRSLAYHKDPLHKMGCSLRGKIRLKGGGLVPASWVRAGERLKVVD